MNIQTPSSGKPLSRKNMSYKIIKCTKNEPETAKRRYIKLQYDQGKQPDNEEAQVSSA